MDRRDPWLAWKVAAHGALRRARWAIESHRYARREDARDWAATLAHHESRLVRDPARAVLELADGKEANLRLAAAALDGAVIRPGRSLSFWFLVGAPTADRGFERGMELRSGCIVPTVGGGLCQIAGGLLEAALRAGLGVIEHHPHSLEIAPEADRIRPFGTGAAVLFPYRDVRVRNDHPFDVGLRATVSDGALRIQIVGERVPFVVADLEERNYRVEQRGDATVRCGELWRTWRRRDTHALVRDTILYAGHVPVLDEMPSSHCYTCDKSCVNRYDEGTPERARAKHEQAGPGPLSPIAARRLRVVPV